MSMFGVLVPGRMVQTDFHQMDETHCVVQLNAASDVNHIAVFMTGAQAFPESMAGSLNALGAGAESSAHTFGGAALAAQHSAFAPAAGRGPDVVYVGVSLEPLAELAAKSPADGVLVSNRDSMVEYTRKMLQSAFNYVSSFVVTLPSSSMPVAGEYIPLSALKSWYETFERRLQANPQFWRDMPL